MKTLENKFKGCLIGLAVGDAIGTTVEFAERGSFEPLTDMVGGGPFNLKTGQWTDDTSMALCLTHSLINCGGFDATDQMNRYCNWYNFGYMSSTGECFDIGHTTVTALQKFQLTRNPFAGSTHPRSAGNGGIMRLAPVAMFYANSIQDTLLYAAKSSQTTHAAPEAIESAMLFSSQLIATLKGQSKNDILTVQSFTPKCEKVLAIQQQAYKDKNIDEIQGTGYVIDALEAALWCFYQTNTFSEAVLMAANLGDDADTTAAITGQIAGAFYGLENIPAKWVTQLTMQKEIMTLALNLWHRNQKNDH